MESNTIVKQKPKDFTASAVNLVNPPEVAEVLEQRAKAVAMLNEAEQRLKETIETIANEMYQAIAGQSVCIMGLESKEKGGTKMKHYKIKLECGCETVWWEADLFPGVGEMAECEEHGTQQIIEAEAYED